MCPVYGNRLTTYYMGPITKILKSGCTLIFSYIVGALTNIEFHIHITPRPETNWITQRVASCGNSNPLHIAWQPVA
ncbi:hypothetical protein SFRURICE_003426 [Spodoptera frugiperda]|nr:hypothetical protein SFRURICE_003426 [Spodoptera frugiperda]